MLPLILAAVLSGPTMTIPRAFHTATVLNDGRVFLAGGHVSDARCEIYDPATRSFRVVGSMSRPRYMPAATLLADGRVLITAGAVFPDFRGLPFGSWGDNTADIFDPRTETFTRTGDMTAGRYAHTATLLPDGRVLVAGGGYGYVSGFSVSLHPHRGTELYDPAANEFTPGPLMETARWNHTATLLRNGTVLLTGLPNDYEPGVAGELFLGAITRAAWSGPSPTSGHTATLLRDGRVLIVGRETHLYDGSSLVSFGTGMPKDHAATLLADGRVLLTGGMENASVVLFHPNTGAFTQDGSMRRARHGHTATLLPDGSVLIAGGRASRSNQTSIFEATAATEIWEEGAEVRGKRRAARK